MKLKLPNETKIRFCNAVNKLVSHTKQRSACWLYLNHGDGDLCEKGKNLIATELVYADTSPEETQ